MSIGIVGVKRGMTRVFSEEGASVPVTVVEATPNRVTQRKTAESDGYEAIQVTAGSKSTVRLNKPKSGHFAKAESEAGTGLWEFPLDGGDEFSVGDTVSVDRFESGQRVDVVGVSKGKGFAGVVKRHNFGMQDATHGNSLSHRAHGSVGQCQTPGRVFKGKKMAGHLGAARVTVQALEIISVDTERNLLLIKGGIPGANGNNVIVKPTVKAGS